MTNEQIEKITKSWEIVSTDPTLVTKFYDRLFVIAPQVKRYFPADLSKQSEKLAYTLGFVVGNLNRLGEIKESIEDLGRTHNRLKIKPEYYAFVKDALLHTIKENLGSKEEPGMIESWDTALGYIASVMVNAPEKRQSRFPKLFSRLFSK